MPDILQMARDECRRLLAETAKIDAFVSYVECLLIHHEEARPGGAVSPERSNAIGDEPDGSNIFWLESGLAQIRREMSGEQKVTS